MKKLEILVVEDNEENRKAAQEYFNSRDDANVNFAASYKTGLEKLQQEKYDFAILDLEIPREEGAKPEKLGFSLAEKAEKYTIPWAIVTLGRGHRQSTGTYVSYFWEKERLHLLGDMLKTEQRAWKEVYETLLNPFKEEELKPTYWALKRINPRNPTKILLTSIGKLAKETLARIRK